MEFHKLNVFTGGSFQVEDLSRIVEEALTFKNKVYPDFFKEISVRRKTLKAHLELERVEILVECKNDIPLYTTFFGITEKLAILFFW